MTGIFDLSGSASEFVMSNYSNDGRTLDLTNSHFGSIQIDKNDYELYQNDTFILGDATKELQTKEGSWYNNNHTFIEDTNNWFIRGGIGSTQNTGIFYYNATTDTNSQYISTRVTIK